MKTVGAVLFFVVGLGLIGGAVAMPSRVAVKREAELPRVAWLDHDSLKIANAAPTALPVAKPAEPAPADPAPADAKPADAKPAADDDFVPAFGAADPKAAEPAKDEKPAEPAKAAAAAPAPTPEPVKAAEPAKAEPAKPEPAAVAKAEPPRAEPVKPAEPPPPPPEPQGDGTLAVTSTPAGAEVFLDGTNLGQTPIEIDVPSGTHKLEVQNPAGKNKDKRQVKVKANETAKVEVAF